LARVRAKRLLAGLFSGEWNGEREEWNAFRKAHTNATGRLAGREGSYLETIQQLAGHPEFIAPPERGEAWPTFAGSPSRSHVLPRARGALTRLPQLQGPDWTVDLDPGLRIPRRRRKALEQIPAPLKSARALTTYPIIAGNRVVISDARYVTALEL